MCDADRDALAQAQIAHLDAAVKRLRQGIAEVYHAGVSQPGTRAAALVEPLWKVLQQPVE